MVSDIFTLSPQLRELALGAERQAQNHVKESIKLEEIIVLPDLGQHIILRFEVLDPLPTLDKVDALADALRKIIGPDYWVTLMSSVYAQVYPRLDLSALSQRLEKLSRVVSSMVLPISSAKYASQIKKDAGMIRSELGLGQEYQLWEVEIPMRENVMPIIRVIGEPPVEKDLATAYINQQQFEIEYLKPGDSYQTSVKAYVLASQSKKASLHYIIENT